MGSPFAKPSGKLEEVSNSVHTGQSLERAQTGRTEKEYGLANGQSPIQKQINDVSNKNESPSLSHQIGSDGYLK